MNNDAGGIAEAANANAAVAPAPPEEEEEHEEEEGATSDLVCCLTPSVKSSRWRRFKAS
jgi:hypothetical protein